MDLGSIITVAGLFIAVYAVIPRVRRLEISLRFGFFGWIVVAISVLTIIYLQFYQTFRVLGLTPGLSLSRWAIDSSNASFIVLIFMSLTLFVYLKLRRLTRTNIVKFREFVYELSREKKYTELFSLIERNLIPLVRLYKSDFIIFHLKEYLEKKIQNTPDYSDLIKRMANFREMRDLELNEIISPRKNGWIGNLRSYCYKKIVWLLPNYTASQKVAGEISHEILINRNTVEAIASIRPYFAIKILSCNFDENNDFVDSYLSALFRNNKSILYHEIRNNQNIDTRTGYFIPERNKLLSYLFADCENANKYGPYKPIGESVLTELNRLFQDRSADPYNRPMDDYRENSSWESKLFVGIRFFDIMVSSALYQNIQWHMWLYYYPHFVESIVRNLNPDKSLVDPYDEWPTRYHYLLYEMVSCLVKWIKAVEHLPADQDNIVMESSSVSHENGNIPKSSILALGQIVKIILDSDSISIRFNKYILDNIFPAYFELRRSENTEIYAEALMKSIRKGGMEMSDVPLEHSQRLLDIFDELDKVHYESRLCDDLRNSLNEDIVDKKM